MKKILSLFLAFIASVTMLMPIQIYADDTNVTVGARSVSGGASKTVKVEVRIDNTSPIAAATVKIKYDTSLELLYVENGSFFNDFYKSAIYYQDSGAQNGIYTYIGSHDMDDGTINSEYRRGVLLTLTFKIPDNANVGDEYRIEILKESSSLVHLLDNNVTQNIDFNVTEATVTVSEDTDICAEHTFTETAISQTSYITPGYVYKECSVCRYAEIEKTPAFEIDNVLESLGIAIRYQGKPSGIAATFMVDMEEIEKIENAGYKVEIGTQASYGGYVHRVVYYGEGATESVKDGKIYSVVTEVNAYQKVNFRAYIIIRPISGVLNRTEYTTAELRGSDEASIYDIAGLMNLGKYSQSSVDYLNSVLNGYAN